MGSTSDLSDLSKYLDYSVRNLLLAKVLSLYLDPQGENVRGVQANPRGEYDVVYRNLYVLTNDTTVTMDTLSPLKLRVRFRDGTSFEISQTEKE